MSNDVNPSVPPTTWDEAAFLAVRSPLATVQCPKCQCQSISAAWNIVDFASRRAAIDLKCSFCNEAMSLQMNLPDNVPAFFPLERVAVFQREAGEAVRQLSDRLRQHAATMPAASFTIDSLWAEARWSATTFQWHPKSEAPPIMGIVFENADAGKELFRKYSEPIGSFDRLNELRVSIIEGSRPGEQYGYSVHVYPDPEMLAAHATMEDLVLDKNLIHFFGQWTRAYPIPGSNPLLPKFKMEFNKHKEFLLAPVVRKEDGQLWTEHMLGVVKNAVDFRQLSEVTGADDPDAGAIIMPDLIMPGLQSIRE